MSRTKPGSMERLTRSHSDSDGEAEKGGGEESYGDNSGGLAMNSRRVLGDGEAEKEEGDIGSSPSSTSSSRFF